MKYYTVRVLIDGEDTDLTYSRDTPLHKSLGYMIRSLRMTIGEEGLWRAARSAKRAGARVNWRKVAFAMVSACGSTEPPHAGKVSRRRSAP